VPAINMTNACLACSSSSQGGVWADHNRAGLHPEAVCSRACTAACMRQQSSSLGMVCLQAWHHILLHGLHWVLKHQVDHNGLDVLPHRGDIFALQPHNTMRCLFGSSLLANTNVNKTLSLCKHL